MDDRLQNAISVGRQIVTVTRDADVSLLAAAVAYYAFVSLVPLLLIALAVATMIGGEAFATEVVDQAGALLTPAGQEVAFEALSTGTGRGGATVIGFLVLAWSGLRLFRGLDKAFAHVYDVQVTETLLEEIRDATVVLITIGVGVVALVAVSTFETVATGQFADFVATLSLVVLLLAIFLPLYYVLPDVDLRAREALPGTVTVAIGWTLLGGAFSWYATTAGNFALYGVLGGVLLLLTWLYFGAMLVILGAVLNAVIAGRVATE